jgi:hypothetical protein
VVPLNATDLGIAIGTGALILVAIEVEKAIKRKMKS